MREEMSNDQYNNDQAITKHQEYILGYCLVIGHFFCLVIGVWSLVILTTYYYKTASSSSPCGIPPALAHAVAAGACWACACGGRGRPENVRAPPSWGSFFGAGG